MNIYPDWLLQTGAAETSVVLMEGLSVEANGIYEVENISDVVVEATAVAVVETPSTLAVVATETTTVDTSTSEVE
ncbi:hypothetical protein DRQ50_00075 [bacterium]|nr:MAG: hypothetical protein DRQ50_00075 [bacterium]RKZ70857.1 MAG: hypothetical protein DRQ48_05365 [Gammaproteobacteria bacterium]